MKKNGIVFLLIVLIAAAASGCMRTTEITHEEPAGTADYTYIYEPATVYVPPTTEESAAGESTLPEPSSEPTAVPPATDAPATVPVSEESAVSEQTEPSTAPETTEGTTAEPSSAAEGEVDLSIRLPESNGTMAVSVDPANEYIKIVSQIRGVSVNLLAAVYSVPQSGQNYVFEFYSAGGRGVDDLRRVYLISDAGKITGVCAVSSSERENISATENWFDMNVLIKGLIFPKIAEELTVR